MIPNWVEPVLFAYVVIDLSMGMYFKHKYQGPYSDGMVRTCRSIPLLTIPSIVVCKIYGRDYIKKIPEGIYKTSWKEYMEMEVEE